MGTGIILATVVVGLILTFSSIWTDRFLRRMINGQIDKRHENLTHPNEQILAGTTTTERPIDIELPRGRLFERIGIRLAGNFTIGGADATGLQPHGMQRAIREAQLILTRGRNAPNIYQGTVRDYSVRGVNDAVGARTASFGGIALARENLVDNGTPNAQTDPGLTVAGSPNACEMQWHISFLNSTLLFPWQTLLDTRRTNRAIVRIRLGILETTAAGDDTDVYVTAAGTTVAFAGTLTAWGETLVNVPSYPFDLKMTRSITDSLVVANPHPIDVGENTYYKRLMLHVLDNDVDSDARVLDVDFVQDNKDHIVESTWTDLQVTNKGLYHIEAWPVGFAVLDFDVYRQGRIQNVWGQHDADLELNVPAGAVTAADRMFVVSEEVRAHPMRDR